MGTVVLNLQKYEWGGQYYLNVGVYVRALGDLTAPRVEQCHYYARTESLFPIEEEWIPERWEDLLHAECDDPDDDRRREIEMLLTTDVLPFLEQIGTEEGLRLAVAQQRLTQLEEDEAASAREPRSEAVFEQFASVRLTVPRPELGLDVGAHGVVVDVYREPVLGYHVEFLDDKGHTLAVQIMYPNELAPA